jgi:hypothetical protein
MKKKSAATHQWKRPDYPDQGVCVHTNCTVMESLSCHPLFGYKSLTRGVGQKNVSKLKYKCGKMSPNTSKWIPTLRVEGKWF